jgi:hypothetical protein
MSLGDTFDATQPQPFTTDKWEEGPQAVPELSRIIGGVATRLETERRNAEQFSGVHASRSP